MKNSMPEGNHKTGKTTLKQPNKYNIALAGNPNVGKTTLYNRITKSFEEAGNWHGVTVDKASKEVEIGGDRVVFCDLPGCYSLTSVSFEEEITRNELLSQAFDAVICVAEVNNLVRCLYFFLQLAELRLPLVLCINMCDELRGRVIDYGGISSALGMPVYAVSAKYGTDIKTLVDGALKTAHEHKKTCLSLRYSGIPLSDALRIAEANISKSRLPAEWCALKLLDRDGHIADILKLDPHQREKIDSLGDFRAEIARQRYSYAESVVRANVSGESDAKRQRLLDKIVLGRFTALPVFLLVLLAVFFVTFGLPGQFLSGLLKQMFESIAHLSEEVFGKALFPEWLISLVADGVLRGAGGVAAFLPQVVMLFFFLSLLEDTGYLTRLAFVTDGMFRQIGLTGRSAFTMLMGFGCTATAVMTARNQDDANIRKKTVIVTPFMSCGARAPVYTAITAAFFGGGFLIVFLLYIIGVVSALLWAAALERGRLKSGNASFVMEMPPYRLPSAKRIYNVISAGVKSFFRRVASLVFAVSIAVWFLSSFSPSLSFCAPEESITARLAGFMAPVFAPLGFGNWKAAAGLLTGLAAKETVVSTAESLGGIAALFSACPHPQAAALSYLVFVLLYVPCFAAVGSIAKEAGARSAALSVSIQLVTAYLASLTVYWLSVLTGSEILSLVLFCSLIICAFCVIIFKGRRCGDSAECGESRSASCRACGKVCAREEKIC